MKPIKLIFVPFFIVMTAVRAASASGLCESTETTYFSCLTSKQRWISLCGSAPDALQYRFGRLNHVELRYPENPAQGKDTLLFAHYFRYQTDRIEISFENQGVGYAVFDYSEGRQRSAGVRVTTADGKESEVKCMKGASSRLGELGKVLRCDVDNALNGGNCP